MHLPDARAVRNGLLAALLLILGIYAGSRGFAHIDPALIAYTSASVFATFGLVYRYSVWLSKPPTALYWKRGWQFFLRPAQLPKNVLHLAKLFIDAFVLQTFIEKRSHLRWAAHFLISWGCIVACAVTFPLVWGWVHFDPDPTNAALYRAHIFGFPTATFPTHSLIGWLTFHILDFCAIAIIVGTALACKRRMHDKGAQAVQSFSMDFLPLVLLISICVTGLMLTVSALWMHGHSYSFLAILHAFSVIVTMLYLPFGKFFHVFQRPANLGVQFYKEEGAKTAQAACWRCGDEFSSRLHVEDLKTVLDELRLDQRFDDGTHYQDICPACRRCLLAANQMEAIGGAGFL